MAARCIIELHRSQQQIVLHRRVGMDGRLGYLLHIVDAGSGTVIQHTGGTSVRVGRATETSEYLEPEAIEALANWLFAEMHKGS